AVGGRPIGDDDRLVVEPELLLIVEEGAGGPGVGLRHRLFAGGCAQGHQHVFVSDDLGTFRSVADLHGDIAAGDRGTGIADDRVTAGVIGMVVRVDDVADGRVGN